MSQLQLLLLTPQGWKFSASNEKPFKSSSLVKSAFKHARHAACTAKRSDSYDTRSRLRSGLFDYKADSERATWPNICVSMTGCNSCNTTTLSRESQFFIQTNLKAALIFVYTKKRIIYHSDCAEQHTSCCVQSNQMKTANMKVGFTGSLLHKSAFVSAFSVATEHHMQMCLNSSLIFCISQTKLH